MCKELGTKSSLDETAAALQELTATEEDIKRFSQQTLPKRLPTVVREEIAQSRYGFLADRMGFEVPGSKLEFRLTKTKDGLVLGIIISVD